MRMTARRRISNRELKLCNWPHLLQDSDTVFEHLKQRIETYVLSKRPENVVALPGISNRELKR